MYLWFVLTVTSLLSSRLKAWIIKVMLLSVKDVLRACALHIVYSVYWVCEVYWAHIYYVFCVLSVWSVFSTLHIVYWVCEVYWAHFAYCVFCVLSVWSVLRLQRIVLKAAFAVFEASPAKEVLLCDAFELYGFYTEEVLKRQTRYWLFHVWGFHWVLQLFDAKVSFFLFR